MRRRLPESLTVSNLDITVHAIGPGYGEAILLTIGDRILIGVDSCKSLALPGANGQSVLESVLGSLKNPVVFWLLTHFHFDHFQAFWRVLDLLPSTTRLMVPPSYLSADIAADIASHAWHATDPVAPFVARNEYLTLRQRLMRFDRDHGIVTSSGKQSLPAIRLRAPSGQAVLRTQIFGATYSAATHMVGKAVKQIVSGEPLDRKDGNASSYIMTVSCGTTDVLFLGDAPAELALKCLEKPNQSTRSQLIKISHHGSSNGTSSALLSKLESKRLANRVALVCPFAQRHLPHRATLDLLTAAGYDVALTSSDQDAPALTARVETLQGSPIVAGSTTATEYGTGVKRIHLGTCLPPRRVDTEG